MGKKYISKNFQKSLNLVTLVPNDNLVRRLANEEMCKHFFKKSPNLVTLVPNDNLVRRLANDVRNILGAKCLNPNEGKEDRKQSHEEIVGNSSTMRKCTLIG